MYRDLYRPFSTGLCLMPRYMKKNYLPKNRLLNRTLIRTFVINHLVE